MSITVEQFVERLTESGLMSAADISSFQDSLPPEKRPKDVQQLAQVLVQHGKLTKYQAQAVYQGKAKGLVFGQYVVLDKLGEGGMGVVLKAQHRRMKRTVAIKVLSSAAMKQAGAVERFRREVEAAARLSHPNIVTAYDADEHEGMHYLAMEYVEGRDLANIVKDRGPMGVREAVDCILQAARGLQYAHEQGVVHRDIKPGNLLLDKKGTVKILDMGLARIAGAEAAVGGPERLTATGQVMGTCDYMAPEQSLDTHQADARADIYSLGCTLHRLLTGTPPYRAETFAKLFLMHLEAPIPSLCEARPDVPEALDAISQRMLAKKPEDRYQSMAEVVAELEEVLAVLSGRSAAAAGASAESSSGSLSRTLAFLQEGTPRHTLTRPKKSTADERTQPHMGPENDTGSNILGKAREAVAKVRRKPLVLVGFVGGLVLLLAGVLVITLRHGRLVVEIDENLGKDVQVAVTQGGEKVQLVDAKSGWTLSLGAGKYDLAVQGGDDQFQFDPQSITVKRGGQVTVKVTLKLAVAPFDAQQARKYQERWARQLGVPVEITNSIGMKLVLIPPGEFEMGSPKEVIEEELKEPGNTQWYKERLPSEGPQHRVRITKPFYLGVYEVTQGEFEKVMGNNPSEFSATGKGKDKVAGQDTKQFPVECVSWGDAVEFCHKLSERPEEKAAGRWYRLPFEAQWEYACRAGSTGRFSFSPSNRAIPREYDEHGLEDYGWFDDNSGGMPHAVGLKHGNPWSLYDIHGNVWEWCRDWYDKNWYATSPPDDPSGPPGGSSRVHRGGGCDCQAWACRSANHSSAGPDSHSFNLGFRVCLVVADKPNERATLPGPTATPTVISGPSTAAPASTGGQAASDTQPSPFIGPDGKWKLPPGAPPPAVAPFDAAKAKQHQEGWGKHLGVPVEQTNSIGMKLVLIPPGEFMMGSPKELIEEELRAHGDDGWYKGQLPGEGPRHRVRITKPFYLGVYPVTQAEYEKVMGVNPSAFCAKQMAASAFKWSLDPKHIELREKDVKKVAGKDTRRHPVETVCWHEAVEFCRRLSAMPAERAARLVYRLPTEAEWEYACRAGTTTRWLCGDDEAGLADVAWFNNNWGYGMTNPVGQRKPNAWGLYDMHGNVWQWCADCYDDGYYARSPTDDPTGPATGSHRVGRGGCWGDLAWVCRSAFRSRIAPWPSGNTLGFRVALVLADK